MQTLLAGLTSSGSFTAISVQQAVQAPQARPGMGSGSCIGAGLGSAIPEELGPIPCSGNRIQNVALL
jgi:hypothetical protein